MINNDDDLSGDVPDFSSFGSPIDSGSSDAAPTPAPRRSAFAWAPDVDDALETASKEFGVDRGLLDTFARIESSGRPNARTGSYKGLFQLSDDEFMKHGGQSNPFDPYENARAGAAKLRSEKADFAKRYGRDPSAAELYMIHQQGVGGAAAHWANPDAPAWQNMYSTGEGRQKGANWARRAIWGNVPDDVKRQYGSVDNITSRDFVKLWEDKVARFGGGATSGTFPVASGPAQSTPASGPTTLAGLVNTKASAAPGQRMSLGGPPVSDDDEEETEGTNPLFSTSYDEADDEEASADPETDDDAGPMYLGGPEGKPDFSKFGKPLGKAATPGNATAPDFSKFGKPVGKTAAPKGEEKDGVGDGIWENIKNPQQYKELAKGFIPGAISMQGTAMQLPDAVAAQAQFGARDFGAKQLSVMDRIDRGEAVPETEDAFGYQHMGPEDRAKTRKDTIDAQAAFKPTPIQDRPLYKAGEAVQDFAKNLLPAAPGYEQSVGRQLGEGLGSMAGGMPYGLFGTAPAALFFGAAGGGEATKRAIEFDKKERQEGRPGLSQEQIALAGIAGVAPGATDLLPLETLLGRLPLPVPPGLRGPLAKAIGRIGGQAFVEGLQEGGQQFLQNLIAREVYNPNQSLSDEVLGNTGVGAGVGGLAQTGKEVGERLLTKLAGGRRARHSGSAPEAGEDETQKALPPPPKQITGPQGEQPQQPEQAEQPAQETMPPPATADEAGWLRARGFDDKSIAEMSPDERAAEIEEAKAQGLKPVSAPMVPKSDSGPSQAPDNPSAEPVTDLLAQAADLNDPKNPRAGVYVPASSLDALDDKGAEKLAQAMGDNLILQNFDDKGGHLVVADYETAKKALEAKAAGEDLQEIIGEATGAGSGKPANGSIVVQQRNKDGAVTRESLVTPDKVDATRKAFARAGHEVEVMSPQEALQRREDLIAQQRVPAQEQGTRSAPVRAETPEAVEAAGQRVAEPTPAQAEAGNYRKGHVDFQGLPVTIETPKGGTRRGVKDGKVQWEVPDMPAHYGYVKGTEGRDGDHVDVFIGDNPQSDRVYVIDQVDPQSGEFDEHKAVLGTDSLQDAGNLYSRAFSDGLGPDRIGNITEMSVEEFKDWLAKGKRTKPAAESATSKPEPKAEAKAKAEEETQDEPKAPRRWDGPELSDDEIDLIVTNWKFVRDVAAMPRPETLTQFVIAHGGLQDGAREVRHIMGAAKERPGLVNQNGVTLDDMALKAWESGFFEDGERPTIADFLNKLQDDLHTGAEVRLIDQDALDSIKIAGEIAEELNDYGITASKFRSEASLREYFGQARPKAAGKAEDAEGQEAKGRESADATGDVLDEVPFGSEPEGKQGSVIDGQAGKRERAGGVRDREDQDQQGAEPAARSRDSGEDRGPAGDGQAGRGSGVEAARETGPSDSRAIGFKTAKGSTYVVHEDGTTTRDKAARPEHPGEEGPQPRSQRTYYVEDPDALGIFQTEGPKRLVEDGKTDRIGVLALDGPYKGKILKTSVTPYSREPQVGWTPVEVWKSGTQVHFGNPIVDVTRPGPAITIVDMAKQEQSTSEWLADRETRIKESKAEGNKHLDQLDRSVEGMRGVAFYNVHDPKERGVVRTVATTGDVVVNWADKYSADKNLVSEQTKDGKAMVWQSWLGPTDLKDYVVDTSAKKPSRLGQGLGDLMGKSGGQAKAVETVAAGAKAPAETATPEQKLVDRLMGEGFKGILDARKFAKENGLDGSNKEIDETVERAVVTAARQIVAEGKDPSETFQALVALYGRQPNLASRTGTSVANQAYSTPMPLAYLASRLAGAATADVVYEPTAGNGALLMEAGPGNDAVYANEIDPDRAAALEGFGFTVSQEDGSEPRKIEQPADAIVANPPFGAVKEGGQSRVFKVGDWNTTQIDHAVSLHALDNLTDNGRAVLILGGTKSEATDERRKDYRGKAKREFYARLYKDYNVTDHFTVSGDLYTKQGASWPVDVIVIEGRGASERKLPAAQPPEILKTWDQVAEKLPNGEAGRNELAARAVDRQAGKPAVAGTEPASGDGSNRPAHVGRGTERVQPEGEGKPAAVRDERAEREPADVGSRGRDAAAEPAVDRDGGRVDQPAAAEPVRSRVKRERQAPKGGQAFYEPISTAASLDTLIPVNMATAAREAMAKVEERRGSVDELVADRLGYDAKELSQYFSAEQVDALAAAIDNVERGAAFVIGDQTGLGKGRVSAGMLRYAMRRGEIPVFLTEKPDLYGDMYRDLRDIGVPEMLGREPRMFITNAGETITLDEEALTWKQEAEEARRTGQQAPPKRGKFLVGGTAAKVQEGMRKIAAGQDIADVIFTTYDQLNTVKGATTPRRAFLSQIAPQSMIVMDECVPSGTQIATPDGLRAIEDIRVGDLVLGYNHERNVVEPTIVLHTFRRQTLEPLYDMGGVSVTGAHPVFTQNRGYVPATDLESSDFVLHIGEHASAQTEEAHPELRALRSRVRAQGQAAWQQGEVLQPLLRRVMVRDIWAQFESGQDTKLAGGRAGAAGEASPHAKQSVQRSGVAAAERRDGQDARESAFDRRQWSGNVAAANALAAASRMDAGARGGDRVAREGNANALQDRYSVPGTQNRDRGGWSWPSQHENQGSGRPQGIVLALSRVDGPALSEPAGDGRTGRGRRRDHDGIEVFNIETGTANYFANGLLVHNCHNAGGQAKTGWEKKDAPMNRADFARELASKAKGVMFSSATYAKRPDVMDLYARTDMGKAVDDPKDLGELIQRGGVPMQQIVASMLAKAGQYLRRERSFDGVDYQLTPVPVNLKAYKQFSASMQAIFRFDLEVEEFRAKWGEDKLDEMGFSKSRDDGVGGGSASSVSFGSLMHNITNQMLLAIKAEQTAQQAIQAHKAGEKPVIALANTNESFIKDFAEAEDIKIGQALDLDFSAVLERYLQRTLRVTVKGPEGEKKHLQIPLDDLPLSLRQEFRAAMNAIKEGDYASLPISPIDWIRYRLGEAGMSVKEVTGRQTMIDYSKDVPTYVQRPKSEQGASGKRGSIAYFNAGKLDALILNRSGSTGVSMHASSSFKDKRKRRMILAQAEGNIDTHLQMLGRVHRTGQVVPPAYSQIAAEIPAEARPTAVLMKKMASLNANTTGARSSAFTVDSVDFINEVGDKVVADILDEDPELNEKLGEPLRYEDNGKPKIEEVARKATGRLVLLDPDVQSKFLDQVQKAYLAEIEQLDALGENPLEAKTVDLQAKTLEVSELKPKQGDSPFLDAVRMEKVTAKAQGRAMPPSEVASKIADFLKTPKTSGSDAQVLAALEAQGRAWGYKETDRVSALIRKQMADEIAETGTDSKESTRRRLEAQYQRWSETMDLVHPGARVRLGMKAGDLDAIVMSVERTGKAKQMGALSAWTVKFAVPDSMRQLDFPMSKLFPPSATKSEDEKGATLARAGTSHNDLVDAFEQARKEGRETRYIMTGNILGGFDQTRGRGRIVNFTDEKGDLRPGILMGREFSAEKFMDSRAVRFQTAEQIVEFIGKAPLAKVEASQGSIELSQFRDTYRIEMAAARAKAGQFFTDAAVRKALGNKEFEKRGNKMIADDLSRSEFLKAVAEMQKIGAKFEVRDQQDLAQSIVSKPIAPALRTPGNSLPSGNFKSAIPDIRQAMGSVLKAGRPVAVKQEIVDAVHSIVGSASRMVPNGTRVFALTRVEPTGQGDKVIATFQDREGYETKIKFPWASLSGMRAFYLNGHIHIVRLNSRSLRAAGEFESHVTAELGHEVIHALRRGNVLVGAAWDRLLSHAKSLRLLDGDFGTYAKTVGDLSADMVPDVTVREVYEQFYNTRDNRSEMMDEEEVAHMMEWYLRGILSPAEVAPVRDLLDAIERGEVAEISSESQLEAEMAFAVSQAAQAQRRELDRLGFYSKALEAAKALRQAKGTPEQMRAMLRTAGVKEAEIAAVGLDEFLADKTSVTKDEIVRFLDENRVEVREVSYDNNSTRWNVVDETGELLQSFPDREAAQRYVANHPDGDMFSLEPGESKAKWSSYSIDPSNPTYRETVIHLADPTSNTFRLSSEALDRIDLRLRELDARASGFDGQGLPETEQAEYRELTAQRRAHAKNFDRSERSVFRSGHWSEPNVIAHARTSLQKTADGKTVFLVDELQSDWGQKLRDGGVRDEAKIARLETELAQAHEALEAKNMDLYDFRVQNRVELDEALKEAAGYNQKSYGPRDDLEIMASYAPPQIGEQAKKLAEEQKAIADKVRLLEAEVHTEKAATPGHPLVNTTDQWTTTAFRRLIRQAVEAGADYIALTPGKVQNERFSLEQHVRQLHYKKLGDGSYDISILPRDTTRRRMIGEGIADAKLDEMVGREVAAKIRANEGEVENFAGNNEPRNEWRTLLPKDLIVGGSGMKATYDSIYPRTLGKMLAKMDKDAGVMADQSLLSSFDGRLFGEGGKNLYADEMVGQVGIEEALRLTGTNPIPFHTFPLTDKVKASVLEEGQPMFAIGGTSARTAPASSRETAEAMERRRQSPAQILRDTGWFRGRDGKWRFEIDDSKASLNDAKIDWSTDIYDGVRKRYQGDWNGRLADFYQHPDLYAAYPELTKASLSVGLGSYYGDSGGFNNGSLKATVNDVDNLPKLKSIIAHEIQHWIQEREGFSPGSSPAISSQMNAIAISDLKAELLRAEDSKAGHNRIGAIKEAIEALETSQMLMKPDWWGNTPADAAYRNVYGEVEARNVQARLDMTADERVATPPWRTEDVAPADIIMRGATRAELPNQDRILSVYREVIGARPPLKNNVSIPLSEVLRDVSIKGAAQALSAADVRVQEAARDVADVIARNDDARSVQGVRDTLESYETVRMVWARLVDAGFGEPVKPAVRNIDVEGILEAPLSRAPEASGIDRPALPPLPQERQAAREADAARARLMAAATAATRDAVTAKPDYVAGIASNLVQHLLSGQTPAEVAAQRTPDMAKAYEAFLKAHNPRDVLAIKRQNIVSVTTAPLLPASALFGARAAGSVIPRAGVRQQAVSSDIAEAINIVNRIAGRDVEVRFSETMDLASVSPEQVQAIERAGIAAELRGSYRRPTVDARAVITLATGKDDLLTTAGHEAWHHVEETLASEAEKRLLKTPSEMRRMRAQVADEIGMDRADPRLEQIPDTEIRAIAFQKYRRETEEGRQSQGIHIGIRRFFDRMLKVLAVVRNALAGHGLNTYEDVFEAARTGEIAKRQAETPSPAAKNDDMVRQDEAVAAEPQDVNDVMASLIPRVIQQSVARTMRRFEVSERVDRLRVGIQDKFLPVRRMQEEKERQTGTRIPINLDTYVAEALFHGRAGEQTADLKTDYIEPLVEILRKAEITKEQFDSYLYARHAQERNAAIAKIDPTNLSGSGMTNAEANAILAAASKKQADYTRAANLVDAMLEETRKRLLRSGLISRDQFDAWSSQYANYVPLRGFEAGQDEPDRPRSGRGFDIRGPEAMQALGRRSKADSPLAYALMQAQQAIIRAEKNRVDKTLYRFIQAYPDPSLYQIYKGEYRRRFNPVTKQVESYWVPPQFVRDDAIHGVKIGGKQYYMELKDPALARAMRGVQGDQHNAVLRGMMWLSRTYASLLTSYNPEFVVSNFLRDIQTALANVTDVADKPAGVRRQMLKDAVSLKSVRGVINALRGDGNAEYARWFEEYRQAGGKISFMEFNDVERIQKDVTKSIERGRFRRATSKALDLVNDLNTAVENGVRLSTYIAMRKAGIGQDRAAFVARELTVNFNRKGEWSPIINSMYLFFNASVQGTTRMAQAIAKSRTLQIGVASIIGAAFMVDWWNYMVAGDDDDGKNRYDKIPAWIKERNLIVMTGRADGSYVQIPMPYGYNLFWMGGQQTAAVMRGAVKPHEAAVNMGKAMFEVMSPIGGANGSFAQMAAPTMVDPFVQVIENKTWYGGPIYPTKYNKNLPDSENAFSSVNPWFQAMARTLNSVTGGNTARKGAIDVSPEVIEHFFEFAGGGLAKFINNAATAGSRVIHGEEWLPEKTPFVRRVYGKATTESRRRDFYAAWEEVDAAKFEIDNLVKNTRKGTAGQDEIQAAREKNAVELQAYGFMRDTQRALSAMRKERVTIELNRDLTRAEKEEKLKEIQNRENGLILRSLGNLNRLKKQSKQPQAEAAE